MRKLLSRLLPLVLATACAGPPEPGAGSPELGSGGTSRTAPASGDPARERFVLYKAGRYAEAEPLLRQALERAERTAGPDQRDAAGSLNEPASLHRNQGRCGKAEPLHKRALAIREQALGPGHPGTALILSNLAFSDYEQDRLGEAVRRAARIERLVRRR